MSKVIAASMVVVALLGSAALADLLQDQAAGIGLTNTLSLMMGDQNASSMQNLVVDNAQDLTGVGGSMVEEYLFAAVGQSGSAKGYCGMVDVIQVLGIDSTQAQAVGEGVGPKAQIQTLDLVAGQALGRAEGQGMADALQTIVINKGQTGKNDAGVMSESVTVMGMQNSSLHGYPGSTAVVDSTMAVTTSQSQAAL